jgi:lipoic acid synthetase
LITTEIGRFWTGFATEQQSENESAIAIGLGAMHSRLLPEWIRSRLPSASAVESMSRRTYAVGLATVCKEALCPNQGDCSERRTATFLILGDRCTRNCGFCGIGPGRPEPADPDEPHRVAGAVKSLGLRHAVITSVTRDDLSDGGAFVFAETIRSIRRLTPMTSIEILAPDFQGSLNALEAVMNAEPDVIGHNLEMVPRLYSTLRPGASYARSLRVVESISARGGHVISKSGIMVGLGETMSELRELIRDLATVGCKALTIGQYLRPTRRQVPVQRFVPPSEFEWLRQLAISTGIRHVLAGPLVRSSYKAAETYTKLKSYIFD